MSCLHVQSDFWLPNMCILLEDKALVCALQASLKRVPLWTNLGLDITFYVCHNLCSCHLSGHLSLK